ncbi:MAG: hypothetical protein O3C40_15860 [Planctomycetota bacterium]|nr:hypothetical protein [Planctomycetota bacterium]
MQGRDIYFRARERQWTFDIADVLGNLPSDGRSGADGFYREAKYRDADWMAHDAAVRIIEQCLREYVNDREIDRTKSAAAKNADEPADARETSAQSDLNSKVTPRSP